MSPSYQITPLGRGPAVIATGTTDRRSSLTPETVGPLLTRSGAILFRGMQLDLPAFRELTGRFSQRFVVDQGDTKEHDPEGYLPERAFVQAIVPNQEAQEVHCENGRDPDLPDLLWFMCERPAATGGQTTLCDGVALWQALSERSRACFERHRVQYTLGGIPREVWRSVLEAFFTLQLDYVRLAGMSYRFDDEEELTITFVAPAVKPTRWSGELAFVNGVTGPYTGEVALEGGEPIDPEILADITACKERLTDEVQWQAGDMLMIDNTRYLHGRRAFTDDRRRLYSAMGMASF